MICPTFSNFRSVFSVTGTPDASGYEEWPVERVRADSIPAITGAPFLPTVFAFVLTIDGGATGVNVYNAYLSQRGDIAARWWLSCTETLTKSGSWNISLTSAAVSDLGLSSPVDVLTEDQVLQIVRDVTFYVQRQSDDAIQLLRFDYAAFGYPTTPQWVGE